MKTALNGAGLGARDFSFADYVALAQRHGFDGLDFGIGSAKKYGEEKGAPAEAVRELFASHSVLPASWGLDVEWRRDEETFQKGLESLPAHVAFAQKIGADRCTTWMPPAVNGSVSDWHAQVVRRFKEIGTIFQDNGIRFGIEWVGPHHLRANGANPMGEHDWIHTMAATLDLIAEIGLPNIGLLVDCYHAHTTGIGEAEIARLTDAQIVHVHVNDAKKDIPVEAILDGDRILPGEGAIDLAGFVRGLRAAGYTGFIAAEILAKEPVAADPETAAERVRTSLRNIGL